MNFTESDWRHLREVHRAALERFCSRVLGECAAIAQDASMSAHDRYLKTYKLLQRRDREIDRAFNDMRRSRGVERLLAMLELEVVTAKEFEGFSASLRELAAEFVRIPKD